MKSLVGTRVYVSIFPNHDCRSLDIRGTLTQTDGQYRVSDGFDFVRFTTDRVVKIDGLFIYIR